MFWNMNRDASQKPQGKFLLRIGTRGGRPDADTKENPVLETVWGRYLISVDVLADGGGEARIWRRWETVLAILQKVDSHLQRFFKTEFEKKLYKIISQVQFYEFPPYW